MICGEGRGEVWEAGRILKAQNFTSLAGGRTTLVIVNLFNYHSILYNYRTIFSLLYIEFLFKK